MLANLYIINTRKILKIMQLLKLNALTLLLMTNKRHEHHIIIEGFENREFCCPKVMMIENYDDQD